MGAHVKAVTEEILELLNSGIKVNYNGYEINSESDLEEGLLREEDCCMKDYIADETGEFVQVNFDIITEF